ncbi:helix-turn-helix transcriptional regulator [Nocardiopsis alba]
MEHLVQRAIDAIYKRHGESLSLDELADASMVSKFHFIRIFSRSTGVTPGRFLGAVRLQEAKHLLLATDLNVADISNQVGYSSSGTFTRRFTKSVGISPIHYRKVGRGSGPEIADLGVPRRSESGVATSPHSITGEVGVVGGSWPQVFVGIFESPIFEGPGFCCDFLHGPGEFRFDGVPKGTWYLHTVAQGIPRPGDPFDGPMAFWGVSGPIEVGSSKTVQIDLTARPLDRNRPPILLALPRLVGVPMDSVVWAGRGGHSPLSVKGTEGAARGEGSDALCRSGRGSASSRVRGAASPGSSSR